MDIDVLVFSKDRAMQVDALLRSLLMHCSDLSQANVWVLYYASNSLYSRQYRQLIVQFSNHTNVAFVKQQHFQRDVLRALTSLKLPILTQWLVRTFREPKLHGRWAIEQSLVSRMPGQVLFLVDDCIFVREFDLSRAARALANRPSALGYSLRLGCNTSYCYTLDRSQLLPAFLEIMPQVFAYNWSAADADFAYPLEVSSSLYRRADILLLLNRLSFGNPNELESKMAAKAYMFRHHMPEMLCNKLSVAFCNPVNRVQAEYPNRAGTMAHFSSASLATKFEEGYRVKIEQFVGFMPTACHQEVELNFERH